MDFISELQSSSQPASFFSQIDAILIDFNMPQLNGYQTYDKIK
jgi:CheY-like chemotaxis protein